MYFFIFIVWGLFVCFYKVHYMIILLALEVLLLILYFMFALCYLSISGLSGLFSFLLVMVCMGAFGISLLINLARLYGRDFWIFQFVF